MKSRKFNGKIFNEYNAYWSKKEAKSEATQLRKKGHFVRVVYQPEYSMYAVFVRYAGKKF